MPQYEFPDLVNMALYTFSSQFYQKTDGVAMGGPASSTTEKCVYWLMNKLQYLQPYILQKLGSNLLITCIPFLKIRT